MNSTEEERTVWCGNLADKVTEELLYELFLQAAPLQRVQIPQDKEGRKSNFAFIVFKHEVSVNYTSQLLNGTNLFNKPLNIKPRSRNQGNDVQTFTNFRDRSDDSHRRNKSQYHEPMVQDSEPFFENLMQMGQAMNVSMMQPTYSSSVDRRPNNFTDSRNNRNYRRDERKPYSRNSTRHNRNHNHSFERQRYY
ncbi:RNA-binding protein 7 [Coccinella septempunctata]|uniref:RNA-binding protein 7 n=1 Tax=Coccinella septempunctata TaxID=41139 RepID=UPI001D0849AF|nr:RNA-binding protein 7 [Coccinella septempunctata]